MTVVDVLSLDLLVADNFATFTRDRDVWGLLRCGGVPIGHAHIATAGSHTAVDRIAAALTRAHAERALAVAVRAWMRRYGRADVFRSDAFTVPDAFEALRGDIENERLSVMSHDAGVSSPRITVAICSRDRPQQLARAVEATLATLGPHDEMLVVLNAPTDIDGSFDRNRFPSVRVVVEYRPGLSWARNRAIAEFRGDVLLFTDDDCVPEAHWVAAQRALFARNPDVDVVTGLVEPLTLETPAQRLFEDYGGFPRNYSRRWVSASSPGEAGRQVGDLGVGANVGIRRRVFDTLGPFDAALGPGTLSCAGDDIEYLFRVLKSGMLVACEPRASLQHEHRRDLSGLHSQISGWSRGFSCAMSRSSIAYPDERRSLAIHRTRIAAFHHARRALLSPQIRSLAVRELLEMRGSKAHYFRSRAMAGVLAEQHDSPANDAPPVYVPPVIAAGPRGPVQRVMLGLSDFEAPLALVHPVQQVDCCVVVNHARTRNVRLQSHHGLVGADRLADAMAPAVVDALSDAGWIGAVTSCLKHLRHIVREQA